MKKFISTSLAFLCIMTSSASLPNQLSAIENKSNIKFYLKSASSILCTILPAFIANAIFKSRTESPISIIPNNNDNVLSSNASLLITENNRSITSSSKEEKEKEKQEEEEKEKQEEEKQEEEKEKQEEAARKKQEEEKKKQEKALNTINYKIEDMKSTQFPIKNKIQNELNEIKKYKSDTKITELDTKINEIDTKINELDTKIKDLNKDTCTETLINTINSLIDNITKSISEAHDLYPEVLEAALSTEELSTEKTVTPEYLARASYTRLLRNKIERKALNSLSQVYAQDINIVQLNEKDFITFDSKTSCFKQCNEKNLYELKKIFNKQGYEYCKNEKLLNKFLDYNYSDVHRLMYLYEENKDFNKDDFLNKAFLYVCKQISPDPGIAPEIKYIKLDPEKYIKPDSKNHAVNEFFKTIYTDNEKFYRVFGYCVFEPKTILGKFTVICADLNKTNFFKEKRFSDYWSGINSCFNKPDTYHAVILLTPCNMDSFIK